jgi:hypothetical protein
MLHHLLPPWFPLPTAHTSAALLLEIKPPVRTQGVFPTVPRSASFTVLVWKVVQTLTSTSAEIYLSMAGAKQLGDTRFILVPAGAVRPTGVCSRHCIALHRGACRGALQARRERRGSLQVPEV